MTAQSLRVLAWVANVSVAYHALAVVSLHVLVPEVSLLNGMVGDYLLGPYQILARTTFLAFACAFAALLSGLRSLLPSGFWSSVATALMVLSILGFLGVVLFPGAARQFAVVVRPATVLMVVTWSLILRRVPRWESCGSALVVLAALFAVVFLATFGVLMDLGLAGLANRIVLILIYAWVVLVGRGLTEPATNV